MKNLKNVTKIKEKKKFFFNKRANLNNNLNTITKSNLNSESIQTKSKLHKNQTHSKYNLKKNIINMNYKNVSHFQSSSYNNSYVNINKIGKKVSTCKNCNHQIREIPEPNNSKIWNNISQMNEQNNIKSYFETNNSCENNKKNNNFFSLTKKKKNQYVKDNSKNNSLINTDSNLKNKILFHLDKSSSNLFQEYQGYNNKKKINEHKGYNSNFEFFNQSTKQHNSSYNNFSIKNSKKKVKKASSKHTLLNESNLTPYNAKINFSIINKNSNIIKPIIKPIIINNSTTNINNNSKIINCEPSMSNKFIRKLNSKESINTTNTNTNTQNKEKIDVQITSINNLLNRKFIKEINNIQSEMDRAMKISQVNSKSKKYNTIKHFFEKFLKKLNEYLNKNTFSCINFFLQKIMNSYHEVVTSFSSENIKLRQSIEDLQKILKESEKKIILLQKKNKELSNQIKNRKSPSKDEISYINCDISQNSSKDKKDVIEVEQNYKVFKLNEKNLDDLDALYFFDKINMKSRSSSKGIPILPIKDNNNNFHKKEGKRKSDINNNFLRIKQAFE
jgi:predicted  nucleic acid-binding Zn-ribbon protein